MAAINFSKTSRRRSRSAWGSTRLRRSIPLLHCKIHKPGLSETLPVNFTSPTFHRIGALLAINLLFLMVWGFTGLGKILSGVPSWFGDKFGATFLARFPGLTPTFWLLTASELLAFLLALVALVRGEFLGRRPPRWLALMLVWSLFVFIQLAFGQWLTAEYNGTFQLFAYFGITLIALQFAAPGVKNDRDQAMQITPKA